MPEVSVSEVRLMKGAAEAQISTILRQLQENTGARVESVVVNIHWTVDGAFPVTSAKINLSI